MSLANRNSDQSPLRLDERGAANIRFPDGLRDRLKAAAAGNNRSMNSEIVARLEASLGPSFSLAPEIAALIDRHVQQEVEARLQRIAYQIGRTSP